MSAENPAACDAFDAFKTRFNHVFGKVSQMIDVDGIPKFRAQHDPGDGVGANIDVANDRTIGFWRVGRNLVEFVRDFQQGGIDVGADLEFQNDRTTAVLAFTRHAD